VSTIYLRLLILGWTVPFVPAPALAADVAAAPAGPEAPGAAPVGEDTAVNSEILVIAARIKGQVDTAQVPVMTLDENAIASYGAATITDLVAAISPATGSGRGRGSGRPVFLVNGQRISSFRELQSIPPEAIRKLEVLPEEVALRFGYPANQRVVNFILKDSYSSKTVSGEYHVPARGGFHDSEVEATFLRIAGASRVNVTFEAQDTSLLTEAERGVIQEPGSIPGLAGDPDPARWRSLIDDSRSLSLNTTWSKGLGADGKGGQILVNGALRRNDARSLFGLDTVLLTSGGSSVLRSLSGPLTRTSKAVIAEAGTTLNLPLGAWQLTATIDGSYSDTKARTDRLADTTSLVTAAAAGMLALDAQLPAMPAAGFDRARTRDGAASALVTLFGEPFRLPAGPALLTVKSGFDYSSSDNSDSGSGERTRLHRGDLSAGVNLALPLTSRKERAGGSIGDWTLNLGAGINRLSDQGTLTDWNAGLTWSPVEPLGLQASYIVRQAAPSLNQLGNPRQLAFNVPVFDYSRGEAVRVTIINGGHPDLLKEIQRDVKLSANWQLPFLERSNLVAEWFRNRSTNVTQGFPLLTPAIEAAFPGRAVRGPDGTLVSIDRRPVTFSEVKSSRMRWGINLSGQIGGQQARGEGGRGAGPGRGPGGGSGAMSGGRFDLASFGRGAQGGRWNLAVYHTPRFSETATISRTGPVLDLLGGDSLSVGGVARHRIELEGGGFYKGFGIRANGTWRAPTRIRASGGPGTSDLRFGATFDVDLRLFVNFDQQRSVIEALPLLKGARLALEIDDLFDSRQKVTDAAGLVPLTYQADYRDARGRMIGLDFRKMF
jgi:iron complex outermembrane receptor protein